MGIKGRLLFLSLYHAELFRDQILSGNCMRLRQLTAKTTSVSGIPKCGLQCLSLQCTYMFELSDYRKSICSYSTQT